MEPIAVEEYRAHTISIYPDECAGSPRDWDNLGTMHCWHRRYDLGDVQHGGSETGNDVLRQLMAEREWTVRHKSVDPDLVPDEHLCRYVEKHFIVLPLFLYDHSGLAMSTGSFVGQAQHAEWDSGQVGFIIATKEEGRRDWIDDANAEGRLRDEVEIYDAWLSGQVYGYTVKASSEAEIDSCWGFYGDWEYMLEEARAAINREIAALEANAVGVPEVV